MGKRKELCLGVQGRKWSCCLEGVEYELKLDGADLSDELAKHSAIVKVRGGLSASEIVWRAELYPLDSTNPNQLRFGYCYCVEGQGGLVVEDGVSFSTPFEKGRIEGMPGVVLSGDRTRAIVTFSGRAFEGWMGKGRVSKDDVTWDSLSGLVIVDRTTCKGEFSAGLVESERELEYKSEYKVVGVDGENYVVEGNVKVLIPAAPILKSALTSITPSTNHHYTVSLTGDDLPESGEFTAQFEGVTETVSITISSRTYELVALWNEETGEHILCNGVTMTTPDPPLLVKISNEVFSSEALVRVKVTLTVSRVTAENYTLEVCDVADSSNTRIELSVEFVSTVETGRVVEFEVYGMVGMWSSKVRAVVGEGVQFTIPSSPVRIESAKCDLFESKTDATITLFGVGLLGGTDFWIGIQEWDEKTKAGVGSVIRLNGKISGIGNQSSCVVMGSVFGVVDPELKYETKFVIVSLEMVDTESFVNENMGFSVPAGLPRLTSLSLLSSSKDGKIAVFAAGSSDTSPNEQFVVSVASNTPPLVCSITLTFPTASSGVGRGILFADSGETADLEYGVLYRVTGVKDTLDNVILFVPGLSFETTEEPTRLTRIVGPLSFSADQTRLLIGVTGRRLDTSKDSFGLFSSPTDLTVFTDSTGSTDGSWFGSASDPAKSVGLVFWVLEELRVRNARVCVMELAEMELGLDLSSMWFMELRNDLIPFPTLTLRFHCVVEGMVRGTGTLEMKSLTIERIVSVYSRGGHTEHDFEELLADWFVVLSAISHHSLPHSERVTFQLVGWSCSAVGHLSACDLVSTDFTISNLILSWNRPATTLVTQTKGILNILNVELSTIGDVIFIGNLIDTTSSTVTFSQFTLNAVSKKVESVLKSTGSNVTFDDVSFSNIELTSSLMTGNGGITITGSTFSSITDSGSSLHTLSHTANNDNLITIGTSTSPVTFTSCSSAGNGGCVNVIVKGTGTLQVQSATFEQCSSGGNGGAVFADLRTGTVTADENTPPFPDTMFRSTTSLSEELVMFGSLRRHHTPSRLAPMDVRGRGSDDEELSAQPHRRKDLTRRTKQHCIHSRMNTRSTRRGGTAVLEATQRNLERIEIEQCQNGNNEQQQQMSRIGRELQTEMDANRKPGDMKKLGRMSFAMDNETRDKLVLLLLALCTEDIEALDAPITRLIHTEVVALTDLEGEEDAVSASRPPLCPQLRIEQHGKRGSSKDGAALLAK
ncbi:hypothetical protein BLNAU_7601 [Blattamonas nauphoetae]|uniref:Uncharacterized protein n=1 Tax=Blattamonas nauphoetae TaxID=2049346 RepID=A0ABQ9Y137_9EUKA|nr:hypothetical protein BLNAU_7601 [Blattamonas nauphoetae]